MARNKKQRDEEEDTRRLKLPRLNLHPETKKSVLGIAFLTLAIVVALSAFGLAGVAGQYIDAGVKNLLGIGFFLVPLTLLVIAFSFFKTIHSTIYLTPLFGGVLFLLSFPPSLIFRNSVIFLSTSVKRIIGGKILFLALTRLIR